MWELMIVAIAACIVFGMQRAKNSPLLRLSGLGPNFHVLNFKRRLSLGNNASRETLAWLKQLNSLTLPQFRIGRELNQNFLLNLIQPAHPELISVTYLYEDKQGITALVSIDEEADGYPRFNITHLSIAHSVGIMMPTTVVDHLCSFLLPILRQYQGEVIFAWPLILELGSEEYETLQLALTQCGFKRSLVGFSWVNEEQEYYQVSH